MDKLQLELFSSIAQTNSLTQTAKLFGITQPAVTHQIKKLEGELGVTLINRANHGISLTPAGKEYLVYVHQLLSTMSTAETRMRNIALYREGHIRIAAIPAALSLLSKCLPVFHSRYPSIQIDIDMYEGLDMLHTFIQNEYDCYFTTRDLVEANSEYNNTVIAKGSLDLYIGKSIAHLIDINDWSTIVKYPFVSVEMPDIHLATPTYAILRKYEAETNFTNFYNRIETVILAVSSGLGLAILPRELSFAYRLDDIITLPLESGTECLDYVFAWDKDSVNASCSVFKETVLDVFCVTE